MERPFEWLLLVGVIATFGVVALRTGRPSLRRQALVGAAIGVVSAAIVLSAQGDLVPDGLEPAVAGLAMGAVAVVALLSWLWRTRRTGRS